MFLAPLQGRQGKAACLELVAGCQGEETSVPPGAERFDCLPSSSALFAVRCSKHLYSYRCQALNSACSVVRFTGKYVIEQLLHVQLEVHSTAEGEATLPALPWPAPGQIQRSLRSQPSTPARTLR